MLLIIRGLPNKSIARQLGVCQRTAANIRADVFQKMGTESAVDLALLVGDLRQFERAAMPHGDRAAFTNLCDARRVIIEPSLLDGQA